MKTISIRQLAAIKRVAQNVNLAVTRKNKLEERIKELNSEYNALMDEIDGHEVGVRALTGGHTSEELVTKVIKDTGKMDKDGKPIKTTSYEPIPTALKYNATTKTYDLVVDEPEVEETPVDPNTVEDNGDIAKYPVGIAKQADSAGSANEMPWAE